MRCELKIYAVSLPWTPTVACRSGPRRPCSKRLWKIKHSGVGMRLFLLVWSHLLHWHISLCDVFCKSTFPFESIFHHINEIYQAVNLLTSYGTGIKRHLHCRGTDYSAVTLHHLMRRVVPLLEILATYTWLNAYNLSQICILLKAQKL